MDSQGNTRTASSKLEQIISHFYSKSFHIIVGSRVPSLHSLDSSRAKKSDKWFHLLLGDRPAALDNLNYWRRNLMDPMIIDIVLVQEGTTNSSTKTVIERWVVEYELLAPHQTGDNNNTIDCKKTYQKSIVLFRSLYSQMRLLPVHRIFRRLSTSTHTFNFDITYKVSSFCDPLFSRADEEMMEEYNFTAVEAFPGRLCISVTYRTTLSDLNLEFSKPLSSNRSMPSGAVEQYHHSWTWTSGFHKAKSLGQNQTIAGTSPICRPCRRTSDFPTDGLGNRIPNYPNLTRRRSISYNEYRPASTFSSPSPSPSHSLSPRSFFIDDPRQNQFPSLQNSSPGNRTSKKIEAHRAGGVHSRTVNFGVQKIVRDNKDGSGRFSGLSSSSSSLRIGLSRSSGKSSFPDDFDLSCPFDVDDVDLQGVQPSQNVEDKNASEITSKSLPMVRQSQDAAIGVLVHMLRTAPPLQQDPSCVPSQSLKTETEEGVAPDSGVSVLRKMDDALEELRSYRKMRDLLLSKSKYEA